MRTDHRGDLSPASLVLRLLLRFRHEGRSDASVRLANISKTALVFIAGGGSY